MDQDRYRTALATFLNGYWGAFHELLEAESVTRARLATSLFDRVVREHHAFAVICPPGVSPHVEALGRLWQRVGDHRVIVPDEPLNLEQVREALGHFRAIYDGLLDLGGAFPDIRTEVVSRARHAHPRAALRADAAP
jgi:hypothetical protein